MSYLLMITVSLLTIAGQYYAWILPDRRDIICKYEEGHRYFCFPGDGDGKVHLIDLKERDETRIVFRSHETGIFNYQLYTRKNPIKGQILRKNKVETIKKSNYDANKATVFLVHGWKGNAKNAMNVQLTEAFLYRDDVNVIVFDWSITANLTYFKAINEVAQVGIEIGNFIKWLINLGASYEKIHLVGFSLGGHVVGNAGRSTGAKVRRITALDPAGPFWNENGNRIVKTDAEYVEVIHTNTELYGFTDPCGDADFFPNGGYFMPGCELNACSHSRSYEYMAYSVKYENMLSNECDSIEEVNDDDCTGSLYSMGNSDLSKSRSGIFRINTGEDLPDNISLYISDSIPIIIV